MLDLDSEELVTLEKWIKKICEKCSCNENGVCTLYEKSIYKPSTLIECLDFDCDCIKEERDYLFDMIPGDEGDPDEDYI